MRKVKKSEMKTVRVTLLEDVPMFNVQDANEPMSYNGNKFPDICVVDIPKSLYDRWLKAYKEFNKYERLVEEYTEDWHMPKMFIRPEEFVKKVNEECVRGIYDNVNKGFPVGRKTYNERIEHIDAWNKLIGKGVE